MSATNKIGFFIKIPVTVKKQGKWYISGCPILDIYSQGTTHDKAVENLKEAVSAFILSCCERGTLDDVLKECGFHKKTKTSAHTIEIPVNLSACMEERHQCHA